MKKNCILLAIFLMTTLFNSAFSQKLAILKPARNGKKSEAIPITKKQYKKLMQQGFIDSNLPSIKSSPMGIVDTLKHPFETTVNWGIAAGDSQSVYFEPNGACYIKAIGIVGQLWSNETLSSGYKLMISKAAYGWQFPDDWWDGDAIYTKEKGLPTLLGDLMWGDLSVTIVGGQRVWTEMNSLGYEPDTQGDGFVITVIPYGGSYMGTPGGGPMDASISDDTYRLAKYYMAGRSGHDPQYTVRHYVLTWLVIVEFYENTPPTIEPEIYNTVLNADPKPMRCHVTDEDANDANMAGVQSVVLRYKVNDGSFQSLACNLISGTSTDGTWGATLPSGYMGPGDVLTYDFIATDYAGLADTSQENSFTYFLKQNEILVFYNDDGTSYPSWILSPYYDNLWKDDQGQPYGYDVWVGLEDGPLTQDLINQYQTLLQIDAYSPQVLVDDTLSPWFASGSKNFFWSSQDWAGILVGGWGPGDDTTFAPDDWHNYYLGLEAVGGMNHDIADNDPFRINPVQNDLISGALYDFLGDSLGLYIYTDYELGWTNWTDAVTPNYNAVVCFTDFSQNRSIGIHNERDGTRTVFLGFDQLTLDTWALPQYTASDGYHWTEPNVHSVADAALDWFYSPPTIPPDISVLPASFTFVVDVGDSTISSLYISNMATADSDNLNWAISVEQSTLLGNSKRHQNSDRSNLHESVQSQNNFHLELAKGEADPRRGDPIVESKGGPDNFGYRWIDSDEPGGPAFAWNDISTSGNEIFLNDDDSYSVNLPFPFPFYGESKTSLLISSNGYLTFSSLGSSYNNDPIPSTSPPDDIICLFWDDLVPDNQSHIYYKSEAQQFIVQYSQVRKFSNNNRYTFQVILYNDGKIKFQYYQMNGDVNGATVGIENADGTDGLGIAFNTDYIHNQLAVLITQSVTWLDVSPASGSVLPGKSDTVSVKVDATDLVAGVYEAILNISSNDPDEPQIEIPVSVEVRDQCQPPYLKAMDATAMEGQVAIAIFMEGNTDPIDAFGFQFSFDSTKLAFNRIEKGSLTQHFSYFQSYQNNGGTVTIGGFDDTPIPANASDTLAMIYLDIDPSPCTQGTSSPLILSALVDDVADMNICNGIFTCDVNCPLGDVNWDGELTPGDALCAFKIFLNDGVPSDDCDNLCALRAAEVNCTADGITPGDALYIYLGYLNGDQLPLSCDPTMLVANDNSGEETLIKFIRLESASDELVLAIKAQGSRKIQAFGMAVGFPDHLLAFEGVSPTNITETWQAFDGKESVDGVIYLGGFTEELKNIADGESLAVLKFRIRSGAAGTGEIFIYNLRDNFAGAIAESYKFSTLPTDVKVISNSEIPDSYQIYQNYPNPFNLTTEIIYELPEPAHVVIELFNTTGQVIRRLVSQQHPAGRFAVSWDGRDENGNLVSSGVYVYRMKTRAYSAIRKLILVK